MSESAERERPRSVWPAPVVPEPLRREAFELVDDFGVAVARGVVGEDGRVYWLASGEPFPGGCGAPAQLRSRLGGLPVDVLADGTTCWPPALPSAWPTLPWPEPAPRELWQGVAAALLLIVVVLLAAVAWLAWL